MIKSVHKNTSFKKYLLLLAVGIFSLTTWAQTDSLYEIPELVFRNPKLISGTAGKEGAVYKFPNVAPGIDGHIRLKKFSTPSIVVANIDNSSFGFDKAFQPEFGINPVKKNQSWYIDFELTFWNAGTNTNRKIDKFTLTSLDVDGDNFNVQEFVKMEKATSVTYSTLSYLGTVVPTIPTCNNCSKQSLPISCTTCKGDGVVKSGGKNRKCNKCDGVGQVYTLCGHPFDGQDAEVKGPQDNFTNIDTIATGVMATYVYNNKDVINFRMGASSGNKDGGAGIRLNSMWFKGFNLSPISTPLPVTLSNFNAVVDKGNVVLSWTGHEKAFSHYVLQRSTDGKNYTDVAFVFANGNTETSNYMYKDAKVSSATGVLIYRLKMVDISEEFVYSDARSIRLAKETETLTISTYPNPVTDQVRITLPSAWQGKAVTMELYNGNGVRIQALQINSAGQTEAMRMSALTKGFYVVKAACNGEVAQQRIVKN